MSFRDFWFLLGGARERERESVRRHAQILAAIHNWGGPRGKGFRSKSPADFAPEAYGRVGGREMSPEEIAQTLSFGAVRVNPEA